MKEVRYTCEGCGEVYQAGKEHEDPKHCKVCAGWLRDLGMGPRQKGGKDYRKLGLVIVHLVKEGKLGGDEFIGGLVEGIRK